MNQKPSDLGASSADFQHLTLAYEKLAAQQLELMEFQAKLQARLNRLEQSQLEQSQQQDKSPSPVPSPPLEDFPEHLKTSSNTSQKSPRNWEHLLGIQGFAWLGILALLTGAGLFIRYAYTEGWLGPWAVLISGLMAALTMLISGNTIAERHLRYKSWAHALMGGGVALLYFLAYAGYHFDYFQQVTHLTALLDALLLMAVVLLAIGLSLYRKSQTLASRAFVLGFFTSLLSSDFYGLTLFYNLFLSLGLLGVVFVTRWRLLLRMGVVGSWLLHGVWVQANPELWAGVHGLLTLYFLLYASVVYRLKNTPELPTALLNIAGYGALFMLIYDTQPQYLLWSHCAYTLIALAVIVAHRHAKRLNHFYHGLLGATIPAGFWLSLQDSSDQTQALCLAISAVLLYGAARYTTHNTRETSPLPRYYDTLSALSLLSAMYLVLTTPWMATGCILLALFFLYQSSQTHMLALALIFHGNAVVVLCIRHYDRLQSLRDGLLTLALYLGFFLAQFREVKKTAKFQHGWLWPATAATILYSEALLSAEYLTMSWAVLGAVFVLSGFWLRQSVLRYQGIVVLGLSGLRLLVFDLRDLNMGWRIASLVVVGMVLMALAWVYIRYTENAKETS